MHLCNLFCFLCTCNLLLSKRFVSSFLWYCSFADNPYTVADKWLLKEGLPLSHRQQIVEFILQNIGQKDFSFDSSFQDPYTGCMRSPYSFTMSNIQMTISYSSWICYFLFQLTHMSLDNRLLRKVCAYVFWMSFENYATFNFL